MATITEPITQIAGRPVTPVSTKFADVFSRATCLSLELGVPGSRRKVASSEVTVDADTDRIGVSKSLYDSKEFKAVKTMDGTIRAYIYGRSLPSMFRSGVYMVPNTLLQETDTRLLELQAERDALIDAFMLEYPAIKLRDREKLRGLYDDADYPADATLRKAFSMGWEYIAFGVPQNLPGAMFAREQSKAAAKLAEATDEIRQVLRAEMGELVKHMVDRLSGKGDGKPKVFRNSLVENLKEFLQVFRDRNITDDAELDALCDRAKSLLNGVDAQALRESDQARSKVAAGFAEIKSQLDGMMQPAGTRAIYLDDRDI